MNQINSNGHDTPPGDVDELLQDTYLLVVELRQGVASEGRPELWEYVSRRSSRFDSGSRRRA